MEVVDDVVAKVKKHSFGVFWNSGSFRLGANFEEWSRDPRWCLKSGRKQARRPVP